MGAFIGGQVMTQAVMTLAGLREIAGTCATEGGWNAENVRQQRVITTGVPPAWCNLQLSMEAWGMYLGDYTMEEKKIWRQRVIYIHNNTVKTLIMSRTACLR